MKQAMAIAKTDEERALVVNRCRTSYSIESLRYVLPYLEQPKFVQLACETIVELAHHRELREPNKWRIRSGARQGDQAEQRRGGCRPGKPLQTR